MLARTELLQRTIVLGPSGPVSFQEAAQEEDSKALHTSSLRDWSSAFWKQFISRLHLDDASLTPKESAKSTNQFFPMPPGGGSAWISAYKSQSVGKGGAYLTFVKAYELGPRVYEILASDSGAIE